MDPTSDASDVSFVEADASPEHALLEHLRPLVDWLVAHDRLQQERIDASEARAAQLAERLSNAEAMIAEYRGEAQDARSEMAQLRERLSRREELLLRAIRDYVVEAGGAHDALIELTRKALGIEAPAEPSSAAPSLAPLELVPPAEANSNGRTATANGKPRAARKSQRSARSAKASPPPKQAAATEEPSASGVEPSAEAVTDEHRLMDLHNQLDMARLHGVDSGTRAWLGKGFRRSNLSAASLL